MTPEQRFDRIEAGLDRLTQLAVETAERERQSRSEEKMDRLTEEMARLMRTMNRLANIVVRHEERLDDLDGGDS